MKVCYLMQPTVWLPANGLVISYEIPSSSVFQFRLANPTLKLSLSLSLTPRPPTPADREVPTHGWRLLLVPYGLVLCPHRTHGACGVCVVLDSKMVGFHSKPLFFSSGSIYAAKQVLKFCLLRRQIYAVRANAMSDNFGCRAQANSNP